MSFMSLPRSEIMVSIIEMTPALLPLFVLHVLHVAAKIRDNGVHHRNDASALATLLYRARWHFWCRRRRHVHVDLCKGTGLDDLFLHGHLCLWRSLVQGWVVKLLHAILCFL